MRMHIREAVTVAVDALRANKMRAVLTSIGVIIGSASIVLVVTVAMTSQRFVISRIEAMGSNLVWAEVYKTPEKAQPLSYQITPADMDAAQAQISDAVVIAGFNDLPMAVVVHGRTRPVQMIGVTDGYQQIRRLVILRGRYFDAADMKGLGKVCLITKDLAEKVYGVENPVGRDLRMGELTFTVIGVFQERAETFGFSELQKDSVIIPFSLIKYYTGNDVLSTLQVQTSGPDKVAAVERQLGRLLKSRHPAQAEYNVQTLVAVLSTARSIALGLRIVLLVIAFIALLISGIGIMNIMLVTVKERTREIGIRKAIGAAQREIMWQFLIEAFLISGGGAVIGILIGVGIPALVQQLLPGNLRVPISGMSVILAFLVSCSTGLFFGWLPARQAAVLEPIESLRYE
jgi:putative ABC transport system permease protein